ncbi:MAG: hypothetical protein H0T42_16270 [Deltaproteobacteria bacterium]|nr:hypothetical protein [Deltaproteobacteria bacterium]
MGNDGDLTAAILPAFLAARPDGYYDHEDGLAAGHDEYMRDVSLVCTLTCAPRAAVGELIGSRLSPAACAEFLLGYRAPTSIADVRATAQAFGSQYTGELTPRGAVALTILEHELAAFPDPELALLLQLARRNDIRLRAYLVKLGLSQPVTGR